MENAIADVIEKLADYVEATETEKQAALEQERTKHVAAIQDKISATTGEDLSEELVSKLSEVDPSILEAIEKLAGSNDDVSLGRPSTKRASTTPLSKEEAVKLAEDRLVDFCVSS